MRAVLRPVPESDPRPARSSAAVAERTARAHLADVREALRSVIEGQPSPLLRARPLPTDEEIVTSLANAITATARANSDGFAVASALATVWPMDTALSRVIFRAAESLDFNRRLETEAWSLRRAFADRPVVQNRIGDHVPGDGAKPVAKEGDHIEWLEPGEIEVAGEVVSYNRAQRQLVVKPIDTLDQYQPKLICEETVYANITQGVYAMPDLMNGGVIHLPDPEILPLTELRAPLVDPSKIGPPPSGPMVA